MTNSDRKSSNESRRIYGEKLREFVGDLQGEEVCGIGDINPEICQEMVGEMVDRDEE